VVVRVKQGFLVVFLLATAMAALGVIGLLAVSGRRDIEFVVMAATGIAPLLGVSFAALWAFDRPWLRPMVVAGWLAAGVMILAMPAWGWMEAQHRYGGVSYRLITWVERGVGIGLTGAFFLCLAPVVLAPRMNAAGKVLQAVTVLLLFMAAVLISAAACDFLRPSDPAEMAIGGTLVLGFASAMTVFALNKFSLLKAPPEPVSLTATTMRVFCPRCGRDQEVGMGESACSGCKLKFTIDVEEPVCGQCGYNLHKLEAARCPECGWAVGTRHAAAV
jgi:hypothetical protein